VSPPTSPRNLTASIRGSSVTLTWSPPADGRQVSAYRVDVGSAPGLVDLAVIPAGLTTSFTADAPNGSYFVRVRAQNPVGLSEPSNEVVVTVGAGPCGVPGAPKSRTYSRSGSTVTLNWIPPAGGPSATSYVVEAGSRTAAADLAIIDTGGAVSTLSATAPPGHYFVRVRGRVACGTGAPSNEVIVDVP
jgi:hypothetical protein